LLFIQCRERPEEQLHRDFSSRRTPQRTLRCPLSLRESPQERGMKLVRSLDLWRVTELREFN